MRITREADYSIRILIRLAMAKERMGASEIAADTSISQRFALKILNKLCHAGLVISFKGIRGGYCLNKPAEDITLLDVITLIDGEIAINNCLKEDGICERIDRLLCPVHHRFVSLNRIIRDELSSITIASLVRDGEILTMANTEQAK
ncbi:MAG TPA: Rrf2 family transcriptional regulator [Clostridiales bacterium]|jgi:Rrf2 family iron-sulfur cluster assembly transcriptional regulator|nr:Rrf2 family transcriptional regulator [Clostridiales bacterium]